MATLTSCTDKGRGTTAAPLYFRESVDEKTGTLYAPATNKEARRIATLSFGSAEYAGPVWAALVGPLMQ
ncbi:hypothetical protein BJF91_07775 [Allorhizobium taibaishanense]|uniref:Uncharacterized protein n=1 Tax=Allorhizobium taibaishanense TaxID=887144 RepID=A0A1Q9A0S5_9HYPH|nr:hypothetical protein [Allorhizobium taibaishanense]OLP48048.1 hypothetical protein BJF91_07775 [Allorhizobium taibaishanense]